MRARGCAAVLACWCILFGVLPVQADRNGNDETSVMAYTSQSSIGAATQYSKYFGKHWRSIRTFRLLSRLEEPLRIYVEGASNKSDLFRPQFTSYIQDGLTAWSNALDGRLMWIYVDDPGQAHIKFNWVRGFDDPSIGGLATTRVGDVRIRIKTVNIPEMDIKANIMHELGHALGINGHSNHHGDIMVGTRRWIRNGSYQPRLSQYDKDAIRRLYSMDWRQGEDLYQAVR